MRKSGTDAAGTSGRGARTGPTEFEPISLPEPTGATGRAADRRRRRRQRRQRQLGIAAALVVLLGAGLAYLAGSGRDEEPAASPASSPAAPLAVAPVVLAQQDPAGRAASLFVLVPAVGGGGTIVLVPPGTMTEIVSLGLEPVATSLELGGAERLQATLENLLGVTIGATAVVDDAGLARMLQPVGPLTVEVPQRVEEVEPGGRVEVLYGAGPATLEPEEVGRFLKAKGRSTDLARLARHQRFLDAWMAAVRARPDTAPVQPPALAKAFDALAGGDVRTRVLPVAAFGTAGAEGELYRVRTDELAELAATIFPSASGPAGEARPRLQILNGTGAVGLAEAVRNKVGAAFDVRLTGNAATFDREQTQIVYYDRAKEAMAKRVREALGVGTLVFSRNPLDVVDVTIIVGKDFGPA